MFVLGEKHFRKWGCLVGPENSIFWKLKSVDRKKMPLTTKIILHFYFPFKIFPKNERERERARARERRSDQWRDLTTASSRRIEIAIDGERGRSEIAPSINDDKSSPTARSREASIAISDLPLSPLIAIFFWVVACVFFWICVFLLLFQTPENFFRKIFWNATKHMEIFSFSGN